MRRRTLAIAFATMLCAAGDAHAASLSVRPAIAPAGATIAVDGAGWGPRTAVTVRRRGGATLLRAVTGANGAFSGMVRIPRSLHARTHPLQARGGGRTVNGTLRVVSATRAWAPRQIAISGGLRIDISRTVAFPTAPVRIDVTGLHRGNVASARLRGGGQVTDRADARGRATVLLRVPETRLEGSTLLLRAGRAHRTEPFYVVPPDTTVPPLPKPIRPTPLLAAAGDIACMPGSERTATLCHQGDVSDLLVSSQPDAVAPLGDEQYDRATLADWVSYDQSWGRVKARSRPAIGNHEYGTPGAAGYFTYFGAAAGAPPKGYYSYDLGAWHVVVLNSNCVQVSCVPDGEQERWLRADLAAHPNPCTLAYWHHPRQSSAQVRSTNTSVQPFWQDLADAGADVVLSGHVHNYERIAPLDADGNVDRARGIRSFVVGTGGRNHQRVHNRKLYSEAYSPDTFGALFMSLDPTGYHWQFQPEVGASFVDSGSAACH